MKSYYYKKSIEDLFNITKQKCLCQDKDLTIAVENTSQLEILSDLIDTKKLIKNKEIIFGDIVPLKIKYITPKKINYSNKTIILAINTSKTFLEKIETKYNSNIIILKNPID
jgi:hypothetical protein